MMHRAFISAALFLFTQACAAQSPVMDGNEAATRAAEITSAHSLSKDKTECLLFDTANKSAYFLVRVRENHNDSCGGAPGVSPTLFFLKIRKSDGSATTTAYDGEHYLPLKPPSKE